MKSHAVTMFEVGKLSDESMDNFLSELEKVSDNFLSELEKVSDNFLSELENVSDNFLSELEKVSDRSSRLLNINLHD